MEKACISSDDKMNDELKHEVQTLRGGLVSQANRAELPERFMTLADKHKPRMRIIDTVTGRYTNVPIFAYKEVRKVLNDLFKEIVD